MQIVLLGTTAMVPTKDRNHVGTFLSYGSDGLLFDCGEGIQRQMKTAGIRLTKITKVFISHWHGDHVLGLPGLLQSLAFEEYSKTLQIYGPRGTKERISLLERAFETYKKIGMKIIELDDTEYDFRKYTVMARRLDHGTICYGFSFIEKDRRKIRLNVVDKLGIPHGPLLAKLQNGKTITFRKSKVTPDEATSIIRGKKVTYISDTRPCKNAVELASDSDILISEATYIDRDKERAIEYRHMTSGEAAMIAQSADVKKLVLTHFSQRYKDTTELLDDARRVFPETVLGHDLMKL